MWNAELFFKWIKQYQRIKVFFGISENSVKSLIWIAVSIFALVAIIKKRLKLDASLYTILQVLSHRAALQTSQISTGVWISSLIY